MLVFVTYFCSLGLCHSALVMCLASIRLKKHPMGGRVCGPFVKETPPGLVAGRKTGVPWANAKQPDAFTKLVMNDNRVAGLLGAWCWGLGAWGWALGLAA